MKAKTEMGRILQSYRGVPIKNRRGPLLLFGTSQTLSHTLSQVADKNILEEVHDNLQVKASQEGTSIDQLLSDACYLILRETHSAADDQTALAKQIENSGMSGTFVGNVLSTGGRDVQMMFLSEPEKQLLWDLFAIVREFPTAKIRLLLESLALDLKYYRSARLKEPRGNRAGDLSQE